MKFAHLADCHVGEDIGSAWDVKSPTYNDGTG